jgi:hypothetical protein
VFSHEANRKNMKQNLAVEQFLAGRRVVIAKFVAHHHKEVQNKARKAAGVVNLTKFNVPTALCRAALFRGTFRSNIEWCPNRLLKKACFEKLTFKFLRKSACFCA